MIIILDVVQLLEVYQTASRKHSLSVIKREGEKFPTQFGPLKELYFRSLHFELYYNNNSDV
jgi:hypothetical protein